MFSADFRKGRTYEKRFILLWFGFSCVHGSPSDAIPKKITSLK